MWIAVNIAFLMGGGTSVKMELLGNATDPSLDPTLDDIQGSTAFSLSELKPLPIVGSDSQFNYVELNWDLTNLGLDTKADERWGFRLYPETSDGEISIASRKCNFAAAGCPPPSELQMSVFKGSQTSVGSVGSAAFPTYFSLMLDDGPALVDPPIDPTPSPVPLPAGLPMLLAALGLLGLRKHWA